jgi:hypothetical protein
LRHKHVLPFYADAERGELSGKWGESAKRKIGRIKEVEILEPNRCHDPMRCGRLKSRIVASKIPVDFRFDSLYIPLSERNKKCRLLEGSCAK